MKTIHATDTLIAAPEDGKDGDVGPSIFYAGDWNPEIDYVKTKAFCPYVKLNGRCYLRKGAIESCLNKNPLTDVQGENKYWSYTEKQSLILARKIQADEIDVTDLVVRNVATSSGKVKIHDEGSMEAEDVVLKGTFKTNIGEVYPGTIVIDGPQVINSIAEVLDKNDYFIFYGNSMNGATEDTIPVNKKYVGRKVYLMVDDQNDLTLNGRFYYGSSVRTSIFFSKQFVEMFCAEINGTIYWIVLQVHELNTSSRYGLAYKTLAYGRVNTSSLGSSFIKTFDGSKLTVTTGVKGEDGVYSTRIYFPSSWFREDSEVYVQATGIGSSTNNIGHSLFANVRYVTKSYVEIVLADDYTWNNGEFFFEVKNNKQF